MSDLRDRIEAAIGEAGPIWSTERSVDLVLAAFHDAMTSEAVVEALALRRYNTDSMARMRYRSGLMETTKQDITAALAAVGITKGGDA